MSPVVLSTITISRLLEEEGDESVSVAIEGDDSLVTLLGMLSLATDTIVTTRAECDHDD